MTALPYHLAGLITCAAQAELSSYMPEGGTFELMRTIVDQGPSLDLIRVCLTDLLAVLPPGCALWWRVLRERRALPAGELLDACPCGIPRAEHSVEHLARHVAVERDVERLMAARLETAPVSSS